MSNQTKVITISEISTKVFDSGTQYKVKATSGTSFKFYDKKKDGNDTVAFSQFKDMGLRPGSTVEVWYKEEEKEYQGKPYTDRLIASFREATAQTTTPTPIAPQKPILSVSEPSYTPTEDKNDEFWEKKAYKQCLWNYWLQTKKDVILKENWKDEVWIVFNQINQDAEKRFAKGWEKAVKTFKPEEAPLPEENINVEDIPF